MRALVVDDEPPALDELAYLLRAQEEIGVVHTAGDATTALRVLRDGGNEAVVRRLAELGIRPGAVLTAVQKTPGGGRVVAIGDGRLALDKVTLRALHICPTAEALGGPAAAVA